MKYTVHTEHKFLKLVKRLKESYRGLVDVEDIEHIKPKKYPCKVVTSINSAYEGFYPERSFLDVDFIYSDSTKKRSAKEIKKNILKEC